MASLTYKKKEKCPKCKAKTHVFASDPVFSHSRVWIEFCKVCGWFHFVQRPVGEEKLRLQIHGVDATDEELVIINKILKTEEGREGNWKELQ